MKIKLNVVRITAHIKTNTIFIFDDGRDEHKVVRPKSEKENEVNDKAYVVEFHGRHLKSLGTRFRNTYVITCSHRRIVSRHDEK